MEAVTMHPDDLQILSTLHDLEVNKYRGVVA